MNLLQMPILAQFSQRVLDECPEAREAVLSLGTHRELVDLVAKHCEGPVPLVGETKRFAWRETVGKPDNLCTSVVLHLRQDQMGCYDMARSGDLQVVEVPYWPASAAFEEDVKADIMVSVLGVGDWGGAHDVHTTRNIPKLILDDLMRILAMAGISARRYKVHVVFFGSNAYSATRESRAVRTVATAAS